MTTGDGACSGWDASPTHPLYASFTKDTSRGVTTTNGHFHVTPPPPSSPDRYV
ncbi:hypothetical protein E2C01_081497 [Portunus trituberculatus]|uniref:Uncharacterized protein n=1 Tax=Portunus trituberculatus TaxID=210409 RepID=A0A5B7IMF1_PORTR|nr:hypothetical protein [Portunus trituberculatus]